MTLADTNNQTEHQPPTDALKDDWFDAWLCPAGASLQSLSTNISEAVRRYDEQAIKGHNEAVRARNATRAPGAKAEPERRARKDDDKAQLAKAIGLVTCNLARVGLGDGTKREVAYSRRKAVKATRYDNGLVQTETFRTAIERMETLGLLEDTRGVYQARSSTLRPTEGFLSAMHVHKNMRPKVGFAPKAAFKACRRHPTAIACGARL